MMQSSGLQASLSGLLAQLFGGLSGSGDSLDEAGNSGFLDALGGQLKELLVDQGVDPAEIAAVDGQELLAQFVALIQGAQPVQDEPDLADGLALGVSDASDGWRETPTDLLGRILESTSAGAAVASDLLESGSDEHSFLADKLARLLESAPAGMTSDADGQSISAEAEVASEVVGADSNGRSSLVASATSADPRVRMDRDRVDRALNSVSAEADVASEVVGADSNGRSPLAASATSADSRARTDRGDRALDSVSAEADVASEVVGADSNSRSATTSPASQAVIDRLGRLLESVSPGSKVDSGVANISSDVRSLLSDLARLSDARRVTSSVSPSVETGLGLGEADEGGAAMTTAAAGALQRLVDAFADSGSEHSVAQVAANPADDAVADLLPSAVRPRVAGGVEDRLNLSLDHGSPSGVEEVVDSGMDLVDSQADLLREDADAVVTEDDASLTAATATTTTTTSRSVTGAGLQRPGSLDLYRLLQPGGEAPLGDQVKWVLSEGLSRAEMKLRPPSLGGVDVKITQEGDKTSVIFVSPHPIVREVLEAAMPRLRDALAQDGVSLAHLSVSDQGAQGGDTSPGRDGASSNGLSQQADGDDAETIGEPLLINTTVSALSKRHDYYI